MARYMFEGQEDDPEAQEPLTRELNMTRFQRQVLVGSYSYLRVAMLRAAVIPVGDNAAGGIREYLELLDMAFPGYFDQAKKQTARVDAFMESIAGDGEPVLLTLLDKLSEAMEQESPSDSE